MNIVEKLKQILNDYPDIMQFTNDIHVDFTDSNPTNFGLSSIGDNFLREDIVGNKLRKHSFILYANNQAYTDYDRLVNTNFLLNLNYYLETVKNIEIIANINEEEKNGIITNISSSNGMLFNITTGDINDGVNYQIQIYVTYKIFN